MISSYFLTVILNHPVVKICDHCDEIFVENKGSRYQELTWSRREEKGSKKDPDKKGEKKSDEEERLEHTFTIVPS